MTKIQQLTFFPGFEAIPDALWVVEDIWARLSEETLCRFAEDKRIERKSAQYPDSALGQYMSMWANTPGGGIIVIGQVDKKPEFYGLSAEGTTRLNALEVAGKTYCGDATCKFERVAVRNRAGKHDFVLAIRVLYNEKRVVKTNKGDAFVRRGDQCHKLTPEEIREIQADKQEVSFEIEPCGIEYPNGFDVGRIRDFSDHVRAHAQLDASHSDEDVLVLRRLGKMKDGNFVPSVACALLFANDPQSAVPGAKIRFLRFDGEQEGTGARWNAVKDIDIEGTVPAILNECARVVSAQLRTFSVLDANGKFYAQDEYPVPAWYEAIVNACVHRSYGDGLKNIPVSVKMFDDRLVIESPGTFPPFVTPENIYESHIPKNPVLMNAMQQLQYVKCAHEGTRRMRETMTAMNLPAPEFRQDLVAHHLVRVTLKNNVHQRKAWVDRDVADVVGAMVAESLSEGEKRALNFLAEHEEISVSDVQRLTHMNWHSSKKLLMRLVAAGILHRRGRKGMSHDTKARFVMAKKNGQ